MSNIDYSTIHRVYKEGLNINIIFVNNRVTTITCKSREEMDKLLTNMITEAKQQLMNLEVYNGLDEAKSDRRLHDLRNGRN